MLIKHNWCLHSVFWASVFQPCYWMHYPYTSHPFQLSANALNQVCYIRKTSKCLRLMCFQEQVWKTLSWAMSFIKMFLQGSPSSHYCIFHLVFSFPPLQIPLPARWQPSRTNTPMHPLEMWQVVMQLTSSWVSEWRGPSLLCTGTVRAKNLKSRRGRWRFPSPSSPSWHCCVFWHYCTAAGPLCPGASWGAREPPSCSPCSSYSQCGSSTSCCPR